MIQISIPNNNLNERKYIIDILFNEFLGLEYCIEIASGDYVIVLSNGEELTIKDTFFNKYPMDFEYLKLENLPSKIEELDIFSASFFMLTRWEEYVNKNRDSHNRFPATESLAFKQGFLDRPIVNESIEKLKKKLLKRDSNLKFKEQKWELFLTHDVDQLYFWKNKKQLAKLYMGDIIKRRDIQLAFNRVKEYFLVKFKKGKDPFDTFDFLMDISETIDLKSRFYFMSGGVTKYDNNYEIDDSRTISLIEKIKKRKHCIGFHPSYNAYKDIEQFKKEKELLEKVIGQKVLEGREHYLRFEVPTTWQIWEDNGMKVDSTCGYADKEGFRCGTGNEFSVFNILTRKKLKLKERPLVVMDSTLFDYNGYSDEVAYKKIVLMRQYTQKCTILWHNSSVKNMGFLENLLKT